jgi:hypothetical protein
MARYTLSEITERALVRADFPSLANVTFVTKAQLYQWVNSELAKLHDIIVNANEDYYLKETTFDLDPNQSSEDYGLPDDFLKAIRVFYRAGDRRYRMKRFMVHELDGFTINPVSTGTVELWYAPQHTELFRGDQEIDPSIAKGWEELVVLGVAIRCLQKENSAQQAMMLMQEQSAIEDRIKRTLGSRDLGEPHRIADKGGRFGTNNDLTFNEGRYLRYRIMGQNIKIFERIESAGA